MLVYPYIKAEMERRELTLDKMAELAGLTPERLGEKLSGKKPIYVDEAMILYNCFFRSAPFEVVFQKNHT